MIYTDNLLVFMSPIHIHLVGADPATRQVRKDRQATRAL